MKRSTAEIAVPSPRLNPGGNRKPSNSAIGTPAFAQLGKASGEDRGEGEPPLDAAPSACLAGTRQRRRAIDRVLTMQGNVDRFLHEKDSVTRTIEGSAIGTLLDAPAGKFLPALAILSRHAQGDWSRHQRRWRQRARPIARSEALHAAKRVDVLFTLFSDVVSPGGMNGRNLADEALRLKPGFAVLSTTGSTCDAIVHDVHSTLRAANIQTVGARSAYRRDPGRKPVEMSAVRRARPANPFTPGS